MKILLFGEFSGLHNNLKDGLLELGHEVIIAAGTDGYKNIPNDINLDSNLPGFLGKLSTRAKPFLNLPRLSGHDVVQIINPFFPNAKYFPKQFFYSLLKNANKKFFILGAGSDAYFWQNGRKKLEYGPFEDTLKYDIKAKKFYMQTGKSYKYNQKIVEQSDGLIPILYEYEVSYEHCSKRLNTIPLPINTKKIEYKENIVDSKLTIFHGLSRYGFKGTRHVENAYTELQKKYPNDLDLIIDGQMSLDKYLKVLQKSNVVIDQVNSYSVGMNGLYALAMGKVVIGGAEPEGLKSIGVSQSPVINVKPSKESIVSAIEKLLDKRSSILDQGLQSRKFVEDHHCHLKIAKKYIDTWSGA